ncbi:MAG: hypothetical protein JXN65_10320 [Clostridia bacterium]|nr:hypothetical protein [Clostridia bacterium]
MSINYGQALKKYLNQSVLWQRCTGHDEYGTPVYAEGVEIKARVIPMQKIVADSLGKQAVSTTTVISSEEVGLEDLIDGKAVVAVEWSVDKWGKNIARQVFL